MPIISIREYDLTKAGSISSTNFSVVVPGFVKESGKLNGESVFDENGVYECSSQADFEKAIGKVPASAENMPGKGPTLVKFGETETKQGIYTYTIQSIAEYTSLYKGILYTREETTTTAAGYLIDQDPNNIGEGKPYYKYVKVEEDATGFNPVGATYYMIRSGNEGYNAISGVKGHMGNQIAYYLLGLGYTVLYKKLNAEKTAIINKKTGEKATVGGISDLTKAEFWEPLKDKTSYDFRYMIAGMKTDLTGCAMSEVNKQMVSVANFINKGSMENLDNGRGDVIVLCEIPTGAYTNNNITLTPAALADAIMAAKTEVSTYAPYFVPAVTYAGEDSDYNNLEFPAAFHYLACASLAFQNYNEWYAVAGYTRGISPFAVKSLAAKLGDKAINLLQKRDSSTGAVNAITCIKGNYYLWGNRTGAASTNKELTAQNFLNIRQLCCSIKKNLWTNCRRFTFDPNSDTLWVNFCNSISPLLERMKADQGIRAYKIVQATTDRKATLKAIIRIVPIEAVEDFDLTITLEDSVAGVVSTLEE